MMVNKSSIISHHCRWLLFLEERWESMIASIVVDILAKQVNRSFDYLVPPHLEGILRVGYRVRVLFGNRTVMGFVVELKTSTAFKKKLKEISDIVDVYPVLNEEFVGLAKTIAEQNFSYIASALQTMIPTALKIKYQKVAVAKTIPKELKSIFNGRKEIIIDHRPLEEQKLLYAAYERKEIELDTRLKKTRNEKTITYVYVLKEDGIPTSKQGENLLRYLLELNEPTPVDVLLEDSGYSKSVLKTLLDKGIVGSFKKEVLTLKEEEIPLMEEYPLTEEQEKCFKSLQLGQSKTYLLHGVTGSGKTLVYIRWIKEVLNQGKQALLLVPEIALTPQITSIFKSYFGNDVAIMHSRLSITDKYSAWKRVINHEVNIVIGARSAIFAPLDNLGIIIIDEEHESSYIQDTNPRYNALDIAAIRNKTHSCPLVLGSATPNVSDYYKALEGEYALLSMPNRANQKPMPKKRIVDMTEELKQGNKSVFSKVLKEELIHVFQRGEQAILFLNRRGHSSFVMCRSCGEVIQCPHCDVSLTYHAYNNLLKCHHCGYSRPNVEQCPSCGSGKIRFVGSGTEKVMEELHNLLPEARVLRVDLDTTSRVQDYEETFRKFKNHEADILVGTQMIAKGLDFANVTLVGIVNADLALHYPSYLANMTAYNLIEQVSGRAGRGELTGEVIVQTYKPSHYVIQSALHNDYEGFVKRELEYRRISKMPPYSLAIEVMVESKNCIAAKEEVNRIAYALRSVAKQSEILGPAEGLPFKLNDVFRFTIQLKIVEDIVLDKLKEIYPIYQNHKEVNLKIARM